MNQIPDERDVRILAEQAGLRHHDLPKVNFFAGWEA